MKTIIGTNSYKDKPTFFFYIVCYCLYLLSSCEEFVSINPPITQVASTSVFQDDKKTTAAISGIYQRMFASGFFSGGSSSSASFLTGIYSDELKNFSSFPDDIEFYTNSVSPRNNKLLGVWSELYQFIYSANIIIEGLSTQVGVSMPVQQQVLGEALFIRAFCHFYLVNIFGDVPLILTTDYRVNSIAGRASADVIYAQIISDLKEAQSLLSEDYSFSNGEKTRPNKWVAKALLSRVYLFNKEWANAEVTTTEILGASSFSLMTDLNKVFLGNSAEAIWQLKSTFASGGINTFEAENYTLTTSPPTLATIDDNLVGAFESSDKRKQDWIGVATINGVVYYYPYKYKVRAKGTLPPITEYPTVFRLAEQYLIRAEARLMQGNLVGAISDIDKIRGRAGIALINDIQSTISGNELMDIIQGERQRELFVEFGHRWLDLKRTDKANNVLQTIKTPNWQSTDLLLPIPQLEIDKDRNLNPQNPGY